MKDGTYYGSESGKMMHNTAVNHHQRKLHGQNVLRKKCPTTKPSKDIHSILLCPTLQPHHTVSFSMIEIKQKQQAMCVSFLQEKNQIQFIFKIISSATL